MQSAELEVLITFRAAYECAHTGCRPRPVRMARIVDVVAVLVLEDLAFLIPLEGWHALTKLFPNLNDKIVVWTCVLLALSIGKGFPIVSRRLDQSYDRVTCRDCQVFVRHISFFTLVGFNRFPFSCGAGNRRECGPKWQISLYGARIWRIAKIGAAIGIGDEIVDHDFPHSMQLRLFPSVAYAGYQADFREIVRVER
uniref:hypothetical protein n=1 Tax=Rhizobium ruizarguesonis TaxID=2081791 RepID=UPI0037C8E3F3